MLSENYLSIFVDSFVKVEMNASFRGVVYDVADKVSGADIDAEFFFYLSDQSLFVCFPRLNFTAGKFPLAAQMGMFRSLGYKEFSVLLYYSSYNLYGIDMSTSQKSRQNLLKNAGVGLCFVNIICLPQNLYTGEFAELDIFK